MQSNQVSKAGHLQELWYTCWFNSITFPSIGNFLKWLVEKYWMLGHLKQETQLFQIWNIVVLCFWKEVLTDSTSLTGWENHVWTVYFLKVKFWLWSNKNCDLFWGSQWLCYPKQISTRQMFKAEMFDQTNDRISTIPAIKIRMGHRLQRGNFYAMDQRILVKGTFGPRLNVKLDCR